MQTPIAVERLRVAPIGDLNRGELQTLRGLLNNSGNYPIEVLPGQYLRPAANIWICLATRASF